MRVDSTVTRKDWRRSPILSSAVALTLVASMMPTPAIADSSTAESTTTVASTQDTAETSATGETTSTTKTTDSASPTATETSNGTSGAAATDNSDGSSASTGTTTGSAPSATTEATAAPVAAIASTTSSDSSATATPAASTVTVRYIAYGGTFASGVSSSVSATPGSTITLPTASQLTLTGNQASTLVGWSTTPNSSTVDYAPGATYAVPDSSTSLYAVWQKTMTLAPTLSNIDAYYMVVNTSGTVLSEGTLNGSATITVPGLQNGGETFVNVFVKPTANYLLTRVDSADVNNYIYALSGTYLGRPGSYVSKADRQRMIDAGYLGTFGWGTAYHKNGDTLSINATATQPTPTASIMIDNPNTTLKAGDVVTLNVTLKAGDIDNVYQATLKGSPIVHVGSTSIPLTNYTQSDPSPSSSTTSATDASAADGVSAATGDTYTGSVQYTLTKSDIEKNELTASVEATFTYQYAFGVTGAEGTTGSLNTTATIDSTSSAVTISDYATRHVSYSYTYEGPESHPDTIPAVPTDTNGYNQGSSVTVSTTPTTGQTVKDTANGGTWTFQRWTLNDNAVGTSVTVGDSDLQFVGKWVFTANPDQLTYYANAPEGSYTGTVDPSDGVTGGLVVVAKNGFEREGWRFLNWNTSADGTGKTYLADIDHYMLTTGDDVLYAQWAEGHRVSYQYNYVGANGIDSSAYPESITLVPATSGYLWPGEKVAVSTAPANGEVVDDPANHGYWTFGGWELASQAAGSTVTMGASDAELLGTWTFAKHATLSYDGNGAESGSVDGAEGAPGSAVGVAENGFEREGWRFAGWNTEPDGSGTSYDPADPLTLPQGATTLYAQWEKVETPAAAAPMTISEPTAKTTVAAPIKAPLPQTSDATTHWPLVAGIASIGAALAAAAVLVRRRMNSHNE